MQIRPMEPHEIDSVLTLFNYYREAADISEERYSEDRARNTIREYCIRPNLFFRVAYIGQRPCGLIGGFLSEDPVDTERAATIQFLYLLPDYDQQENYQQLIEQFSQWGRSAGATNCRAIDIGNNTRRLEAVYAQLGFDPIRVSIMTREIA